ncbi:1568_t:CDS:2 [Cetraspora pellucida]|uniref:1568_t:CDS:1 n=1 Tax=Cetraspora pellucida TaxID=1433469 RepID=A0A9N8Z1V3_9GLOM|nr:1568_t:CDS:2 [Cetraspora pellucida]
MIGFDDWVDHHLVISDDILSLYNFIRIQNFFDLKLTLKNYLKVGFHRKLHTVYFFPVNSIWQYL